MTMILGLGQTLGPIFGTVLTQVLNYRWTCDIFALNCLFFGTLYFFFCDGIGAFKKTFSSEDLDEKKTIS